MRGTGQRFTVIEHNIEGHFGVPYEIGLNESMEAGNAIFVKLYFFLKMKMFNILYFVFAVANQNRVEDAAKFSELYTKLKSKVKSFNQYVQQARNKQ